jgi:tetratricopeptide (TPR) repeat protein
LTQPQTKTKNAMFIKSLYFAILWVGISSLPAQDAQSYFASANQKFNQGKYEEALIDYRKAIQLKPDFAEAYHNLGNIQYLLQDYEGALVQFNKSIQLKPNAPEAYSSRGALYYVLKKYKDALEDLNKAITLNSTLAEALQTRGSLYNSLGKKEEACQDWQKAASLGNLTAKEKVEKVCGVKAKQPEVRKNEIPNNIKNPTTAEDFADLGDKQVEWREYEKAILSFDKAIGLKPNLATAYFGRAGANFAMGEHEKACEDWHKALDLGYKKAKEMIDGVCK